MGKTTEGKIHRPHLTVIYIIHIILREFNNCLYTHNIIYVSTLFFKLENVFTNEMNISMFILKNSFTHKNQLQKIKHPHIHDLCHHIDSHRFSFSINMFVRGPICVCSMFNVKLFSHFQYYIFIHKNRANQQIDKYHAIYS